MCLLALGAVPWNGTAAAVRTEHGGVTPAQDLLLSLRAVFAPQTLPSPLRQPDVPLKSATSLLREYDATRDALPLGDVAQVEEWLAADPAATGTYETEHFRLAYATEGAHAVPLADVAPANGVPDFVERVAAWGELSWTRLIEDAGFRAPLVADGRVSVSFLAMSAYGYTRVVDGVPALTLHATFAGFPANDDPDGSAAGAAKVTMAHELKHASQYASSGWTEGGWLEADAVWAEELVFDETNDYLRFLGEGSPISSPSHWLPVSYEDCVFAMALAERFGTDVLVDFFVRRGGAPGETVPASWDAVLRARGSSWRDGLATLALWSWFCGANAPGRPEGFEEAERYPTPPIAAHLETTRQSRLPCMGSEYLLATAPGRTGHPHVSIAGDLQAPFGAWVVTLERSGRRDRVRIPTSVANAGAVELPQGWDDLATVAILVTNAATSGDAPYGVTLDGNGAVDAVGLASAAGFLLHPNRPNPFRESTTLAFSLASPASVRITVYDAAGRLVRRLADGEAFPQGRHERAWDGRDGAGRAAAPGLYAVRVEADGASSTRKLLIVR